MQTYRSTPAFRSKRAARTWLAARELWQETEFSTRRVEMTQYAVFRIGSNAANQPMTYAALVAIVEAQSAAEACATEPFLAGTIYATSQLIAAPDVHAWHNQHFEAWPVRGRTMTRYGRKFNLEGRDDNNVRDEA